MPANRPNKTICYFNRDQQYFASMQNLNRGIVIQPPGDLKGTFSLDKAAELIASSAKLQPSQLLVAWLSQDRIVAIPPLHLNRDEIITAIPRAAWDEGFTFHSYSPHIDASISIPRFKVWIDLHGVPLQFCSEQHLARAVSSFGTLLGSMEPPKLGDVQSWSLFITTDDLSLIPLELEFRAGGLVYLASVRPRRWIENPVYHRFDLPPMMISFQPPRPLPIQAQSMVPAATMADDIMPMRLTVLREIFKNVPMSDLPQDLAACLAGNRAAIEANQAAYRAAGHYPLRPPSVQHSHVSQSPPQILARQTATVDPTEQTLGTPIPDARSTPDNRPSAKATVHGTDQPASPAQHVIPDLSLEVCTQPTYHDRLDPTRNNWDPHLLFPELRTDVTRKGKETFIANRTNPSKGRKPPKPAPPQSLSRTAEGRIGKKADSKNPFSNLEAKDFVDIPLKYAEGRQLLDLIGGHTIPIPPRLMDPPQASPSPRAPKPNDLRTGPSSSAGLAPTNVTSNDQQAQASRSNPVHTNSDHQPQADRPNEASPTAGSSNTERPTQADDALDDPYLDNVDYSDDDYEGLG